MQADFTMWLTNTKTNINNSIEVALQSFFLVTLIRVVTLIRLMARVYPFTGLDYWTEIYSFLGQVCMYVCFRKN